MKVLCIHSLELQMNLTERTLFQRESNESCLLSILYNKMSVSMKVHNEEFLLKGWLNECFDQNVNYWKMRNVQRELVMCLFTSFSDAFVT